LINKEKNQELVAHACNPSFSGGRDQEDRGLKPAWANSLVVPISKIPTQKRASRVVQVVDFLPSKCEALSSNSKSTKNTQPSNKEIDLVAYQENDPVNKICRESWTQC
jgi:hypothetical protein